MSSFSMDTRTLDVFLTTGHSLVKDRLYKTAVHQTSIHPHYGFVCGRHDAA